MSVQEAYNSDLYAQFLKSQTETSDKLEYYNGTIFNMSPKSIKHNEIISNILVELKKYFKGSNCKVYSEQIPIIFEDDLSKYEFQPDIFLMCAGQTKGEKFISTPEIVFEVISKTTANNDLFRKPLVYEKFGVKEYNIIQQDGKLIQYGLVDDIYEVIANLTIKDTYESIVFNDLKIKMEEIFE